MCYHLVDFPSSLVNLFIVLPNHLHGEWLLVVGEVIVFGSGVAGLSVLFPHAHSTHEFPFTPLHRGLFIFLTQRSVLLIRMHDLVCGCLM